MSLNFLFSIYRDGLRLHREFYWLDFVQNLIRTFSNQWFLAFIVWIYAGCAQLVILYQHRIIEDVTHSIPEPKEMSSGTSKTFQMHHETFDRIQRLINLTETGAIVSKGFGFALMVNNCSNLMSMVTLTFHAIEDGIGQHFVFTLHDVVDVVDSFLRYFVISYTADRLEGKVIIVQQVSYS